MEAIYEKIFARFDSPPVAAPVAQSKKTLLAEIGNAAQENRPDIVLRMLRILVANL